MRKKAILEFEASLRNHPKSNLKTTYPAVYEELCSLSDSIMFSDYKKYLFDFYNAVIKIDISAEGVVSVILTYNDMGEYRKQLKLLEDNLNNKLADKTIRIHTERNNELGIEVKIPMSCTIKYGLIKKSKSFNVEYKK